MAFNCGYGLICSAVVKSVKANFDLRIAKATSQDYRSCPDNQSLPSRETYSARFESALDQRYWTRFPGGTTGRFKSDFATRPDSLALPSEKSRAPDLLSQQSRRLRCWYPTI